MKKLKNSELCSKSGVALIMVLGLLSILTLLAIAFAIAMRVERIAARNYANGVRAKHLVEAALSRAMDHVGETMAGAVYPCWDEQMPDTNEAVAVYDALPSYSSDPGDPKCTDLITGEALANVPFSLRQEVFNATNYVYWKEVLGEFGETNGRISYMVINSSGLIDANYAGGGDYNTLSLTNLNQIDVGLIRSAGGDSDIKDAAAFIANRDRDIRYETITELVALNNSGANVVDEDIYSMGTYSFDPDKDTWFRNRELLGRRADAEINLSKKFNLNAFTNWWPGGDSTVNTSNPTFYPFTYPAMLENPFALQGAVAGGSFGSQQQSLQYGYIVPLKAALLRSGFARAVGSTVLDTAFGALGGWSDDSTTFLINLFDFFDKDRGATRWNDGGSRVAIDSYPEWEEIWIESVGGAAYPRYRVGTDIWYNKVPRTCEPGEFKLVVTARDFNFRSYHISNPRSCYYIFGDRQFHQGIPDNIDHSRVTPRTLGTSWRWDMDLPEMRWPEKQLITMHTAPSSCTIDRVPDSLPVVVNGGSDGRIVPNGQDSWFAGKPYNQALAANMFDADYIANALTYVDPPPLGSDPRDGRGYITFPYVIKEGSNQVDRLYHIAMGGYPNLVNHFPVSTCTNMLSYYRLTSAQSILDGNTIRLMGPATRLAADGLAFNNKDFYMYDLLHKCFPQRGTNYWEVYGIDTSTNMTLSVAVTNVDKMIWGMVWAEPLVCWTTNYGGDDYTLLCSHADSRQDTEWWSYEWGGRKSMWDDFGGVIGFHRANSTYGVMTDSQSKSLTYMFSIPQMDMTVSGGIRLGGDKDVNAYHFLEPEKSVKRLANSAENIGYTWKQGLQTPEKGSVWDKAIDQFYDNPARLRGGLPMYIADKPMEMITEFGFVHMGGISGENNAWLIENKKGNSTASGNSPPPSLFNRRDGAGIMDQMSLRDPRAPVSSEGVFALSSGQKDVLYGLLRNIRINRNTNYTGLACYWEPDEDALKILADELIENGPYISWYDVWGWDYARVIGSGSGGSVTPYTWANGQRESSHSNRVANAIRNVFHESKFETSVAVPGAGLGHAGIQLGKIYPKITVKGTKPSNANDLKIWNTSPVRALEIDFLSQLAEIISFRNNYLTIIVAAQALGMDNKTVVAEKRAIASVYRDSYTGKHFIRSFKWLNE